MYRHTLISLSLIFTLILLDVNASSLQARRWARARTKVASASTTAVDVTKFKANARPLPDDHWSRTPVYRLPRAVRPVHYDLKIIPILGVGVDRHDPFTAPGSVRIDVHCVEPTDNVTLHASPQLLISEESIRVVEASSNSSIPILGYERNEILDFFVIKLAEQLESNKAYQIHIDFVAPIARDVLNGLYLSTYLNPDTNNVSYAAATQFQMFSFRQMVPGFDEPGLKATFDISIGYLPTKYGTLSNTDVVSTSPVEAPGFEGWLWDHYRRTVVMSSYLIALLVSDFTYAEAPPGLYRKPVRIYGVPHQIANGDGQYAAETSARMLAFYEEYYETEYPMPKMDTAAIPDFLYGAMENWGLNTYRPIFLLHTAGVTTEKERGVISHTLAHELGHQWFGNLVTCAWWNDIWLNEGLTTYASVIAWQHTQPEFEPLKYFHVNAFQNSLLTEEFGSSLGKELENNGSSKIADNFGDVTARKGSCLVKMMDSFLGPETVRKGIVNFLQGLSYQGANQDDFFAYLSAQAEVDGTLPEGLAVKDVMDTWTYNRGFPILYVHNVTGDNVKIHIRQQQYRGINSTQEDSTGWYIPIAIATEDDPDFESSKPQLWMKPLQTEAMYRVGNLSKWVIVNPSARGYYRVVYNAHLTQLIWDVLASAHTSISPQSRSQFIDDYFMTAFQNATDFMDIEMALGFTKYLGKEYDRIVWETLILNLKSTFYQLMGTEAFPEFKKYFLPKMLSALSIIGFRQESHHKGANVILRALLLDWICKMGSDECNAYTKEFMDKWKANPGYNPIPPDLQPIIYCNAIAAGNQSDVDFILRQYESGAPVQKPKLLGALVCSPNTAVLQSLLDEALAEDSTFDDADRVVIVQKVTTNMLGRNLVLSMLQSNLTAAIDQFGTPGMSRIVNNLCLNMGTPEELMKVTAFIADNEVELGSLSNTLRGFLSKIRTNINWRSQYVSRLANWFSRN